MFSFHDSTATLDAARASSLIRAGLRAGRIDDLVGLLGLDKKEEDLSNALNTNGTSLWRWAKDDKPLPGATVEQILRAMQLQFLRQTCSAVWRLPENGFTNPIHRLMG